MLLIIGGRYLVFSSLFGMRLYWALGLSLAGAGFALGWLGASAFLVAAVGAALEIAFALACLAQHRRWLRRGDTPSPALLRDAA
jgi:hypothetical protein